MNKFASLPQNAYELLSCDPELGRFVDISLPIPAPFHGNSEIRLVILGQDSMIVNPSGRSKINTSLNLGISGNLRSDLLKLCSYLGLELILKIYATNLYNNFFIEKPTILQKIVDVFKACLPCWLPVLLAEL